MGDYFNRKGEPIDMLDWARLLESDEYRSVGLDLIGDVRVSTVWLGLNHRHGAGAPLIFETLVFGGEHNDHCERYITEEQAIEGHARAVALVRGAVVP